MEENNDSDTSNSEQRTNLNRQFQDAQDASKTFLQVNISGNSNDSCSEDIQTQSSESKHSQHKDLMNCIAFEKKNEIANDGELWNETRYSDDFDSLSSDTTSDITDVSPPPPSPPPSSSGCSSLMKGDTNRERKFNSRSKLSLVQEQKTGKHVGSKSEHKNEETRKNEDDDEQSLTFLKDALHNLDCHSSVKSFSTVRQHIFPQQKNLTFNKDQMRNINRENMILLKKIQSNRNRSKLDAYSSSFPRVSSSAINRQRQQRKIEFENSILLQKIQRVKGTTNTMRGFRRF